jgi:hypothetical protein
VNARRRRGRGLGGAARSAPGPGAWSAREPACAPPFEGNAPISSWAGHWRATSAAGRGRRAASWKVLEVRQGAADRAPVIGWWACGPLAGRACWSSHGARMRACRREAARDEPAFGACPAGVCGRGLWTGRRGSGLPGGPAAWCVAEPGQLGRTRICPRGGCASSRCAGLGVGPPPDGGLMACALLAGGGVWPTSPALEGGPAFLREVRSGLPGGGGVVSCRAWPVWSNVDHSARKPCKRSMRGP